MQKPTVMDPVRAKKVVRYLSASEDLEKHLMTDPANIGELSVWVDADWASD